MTVFIVVSDNGCGTEIDKVFQWEKDAVQYMQRQEKNPETDYAYSEYDVYSDING